jgi:hypothetical protein
MGFNNLGRFATAQDNGEGWLSFIHKSSSPATLAAGLFADLSMGAGIPKYNAYVGTQYEATQAFGSGNAGIYAPTPPAGKSLHIADMQISTSSTTLPPALFVLCDYLLYYPLIDMDSTDLQTLDNPVGLPRYSDGLGVKMALISYVGQTASAQYTISYTNEKGVSGRTATGYTNGTAAVGLLQHGNRSGGGAGTHSLFIPLQNGDKGVRSVESIINASGSGGFCTLVLLTPLAQLLVSEANTASEIDYWMQRPSAPRVMQGAYLNFLMSSGGSAVSSQIRGFINYAWG